MKRVAYLGPEGTVSQEAARTFLANNGSYEYIPYKYISDVYMATASGETDYSVVPVENTIDSAVSLHLDWLVHEVDLPIQAEWVYPSVQNLIGFGDGGDSDGGTTSDVGSASAAELDRERLAQITTIYSIPVAIAQCQKFLRRHMPHVEFEHVSSTAEGVRIVKQQANPALAAIGTKLAAKLYGLNLLADNISDHDNNFTRFIMVGKSIPDLQPSQLMKTTLLVTLPEDYPGALHQVLSAFAWRHLNLSKIESRPTRKKLGSYYFFVDVEASMQSVLLPAAIEEIEAIGCQVRILGSYPSYSFESFHSEV